MYDALFGNNAAFLFRRLRCARELLGGRRGVEMYLIAASAIMAEAVRHMEALVGRPFAVLDESRNGAPHRGRDILHVRFSPQPQRVSRSARADPSFARPSVRSPTAGLRGPPSGRWSARSGRSARMSCPIEPVSRKSIVRESWTRSGKAVCAGWSAPRSRNWASTFRPRDRLQLRCALVPAILSTAHWPHRPLVLRCLSRARLRGSVHQNGNDLSKYYSDPPE